MIKINKQKALLKTRKKVSKEWQTYREKKSKILTRRISSMTKQKLIQGLKAKTLENISGDFATYRIKVYNADTKHPLIKKREYKIKTGFEEHFKVRKPDSKSAYKALLRAKRFSDIRYILVTIELYMIDTDSVQYISQTFSPLAVERIDENVVNDIINSFILKNSNTSQINNDYTIKNVFIRLIYEKTKTNIKTKQVRKYRQAKA
jgi:hypothetical protein